MNILLFCVLMALVTSIIQLIDLYFLNLFGEIYPMGKAIITFISFFCYWINYFTILWINVRLIKGVDLFEKNSNGNNNILYYVLFMLIFILNFTKYIDFEVDKYSKVQDVLDFAYKFCTKFIFYCAVIILFYLFNYYSSQLSDEFLETDEEVRIKTTRSNLERYELYEFFKNLKNLYFISFSICLLLIVLDLSQLFMTTYSDSFHTLYFTEEFIYMILKKVVIILMGNALLKFSTFKEENELDETNENEETREDL
jgi:hypothetical protein